jgi:YD repeat-containing protein
LSPTSGRATEQDGKEPVTYYGWDGDRLVHTERVKAEDGQTSRQIEHVVYEPGSFTPLVKLSTTAKGDPQARPHLAVQALEAAMPGQARNDPGHAQNMAMMQTIINAMPEHQRKQTGQSLEQVIMHGLPQRALNSYPDASADQPHEIQDARGGIKKLEWNAAGQLSRYTDCSGGSTSYHYDLWGQPIQIQGEQELYQSSEYDDRLSPRRPEPALRIRPSRPLEHSHQRK